MKRSSSALPQSLRAGRRARSSGRLARLLVLYLAAFSGCRERIELGPRSNATGAGGARPSPASDVAAAGADAGAPLESPAGGGTALPGDGSEAGTAGAPAARSPAVIECERTPVDGCRVDGDSTQGVRLIGTLLEPLVTRERGVLDIDPKGVIRCVGCDCGDAAGALVIDCPDLIVSPGFINLHDHLSYAGTPPLPHPNELYQHRNDWRLGDNGHEPLPFAGNASTAQVLAQELRMLMGGATSIVGAGGRRGLLRNLDMPGLTEQLLPGRILTAAFPLDDARGAVDSAACSFGERPDTAASAASARAYVPHVGEGTNERAEDELRCALGSLDLLGSNSAVIHAMALSRADAHALAERGASVVWSPRSNLDLYGATAPVALLSGLGVNVALGTDWLASGSMNLLRELACAREYDLSVLGGYFAAADLWRMVTANAAGALRLENRLGVLQPGVVGDIAVFTGQGADPHAEVLEAGPQDVRLMLRQGQALYGDEQLVTAFSGSQTCEPLEVCQTAKLACVAETGLELAEIRDAGEAVYPLFSCEAPPPDEPSCQGERERECAAGETECEPPSPIAAPSERDTDADGFIDALDRCPRVADPDQADADRDGHGDACDPCPLENPGLAACPLSIAALRAPSSRLPLQSAVELRGARVSALRLTGAKGFYLEDGNHGPFSGIFVYTDVTPGVSAGELVDVQGYFEHYRGTDELVDAEVLASTPGGAYDPLEVTLQQLADGAPDASAFDSLWVRVESVEVELENPDAPSDYDETLLLGGLRIDDSICPELDNTYPSGTRFRSLRGIAGFSFSHRKLFPTRLEDLVVE